MLRSPDITKHREMISGSNERETVGAPPGQTQLEPPRCPEPGCPSTLVVQNGSYSTKTRGLVRRFSCRDCGCSWKRWEKASCLFDGSRFVASEDSGLQGFALVALGLPLAQVEGLMRRKAETIRDQLVRSFKKKGVWDRIVELLVSRYNVGPEEVKSLSSLMVQIESGTASFHSVYRS